MSNYPEDVTGNTPEAPFNQVADSQEPLDDTTKIDVLLTAIAEAKDDMRLGYVEDAIQTLEEAEREVLRD